MLTRSNAPLARKLATCLLVATTACSEGAQPGASIVDPVVVASVAVSPPSGSIPVGGSLQLGAMVRDAGGKVLGGRSVAWSTGNASVATVSGSGLVTGASVGTVMITGTSEGKSNASQITVTAAAVSVASVDVNPPTRTINVGGTTQLSAVAKDASGNVLTGRPITWSTGNASVATVSASGLVTGVGAGTTTITGASEGKSDGSQVTVNAAAVPVASVQVSPPTGTINVGGTTQLTAVAKDGSGNVLAGRPITWTTGNGSVATVSSSGLVTGAGAGTTTITATSEGKSAGSQITVNSVAGPVASVTIDSPPGLLSIGQTLNLTAIVKDASGNVLNRPVTWQLSRTGVVLGSASGAQSTIQAIGLGAVLVTATSDGVSNFALIWVYGPLTCATVAGGEIWAADDQYLGRLTNQYDSQSIINQYGSYGSQYSATSIYNQYGQYGSAYGTHSAYNSYASSPPRLLIRGLYAAFITKNTIKSSRIDPDILKTCSFP